VFARETTNTIENLSSFIFDRLVCPLSKNKLVIDGDSYLAPCGFRYRNGDFRIGLDFDTHWARSQRDYEAVPHGLLATRVAAEWRALIDETNEIYERIRLEDSVLDVGGAWGLLAQQAGLDRTTFVAVDPIRYRWRELSTSGAFAEAFSNCAHVCRIQAFAEFLPFDGSFQWVHMRSCIDYFANPLLALREAFRILRPDGGLVVGVALEGAYRRGPLPSWPAIKRLVRRTPIVSSIAERLFDHHIFHSTYDALLQLLESGSFSVVKEVWQSQYFNVLYWVARKEPHFGS